jgi:hypothetical protein
MIPAAFTRKALLAGNVWKFLRINIFMGGR